MEKIIKNIKLHVAVRFMRAAFLVDPPKIQTKFYFLGQNSPF